MKRFFIVLVLLTSFIEAEAKVVTRIPEFIQEESELIVKGKKLANLEASILFKDEISGETSSLNLQTNNTRKKSRIIMPSVERDTKVNLRLTGPDGSQDYLIVILNKANDFDDSNTTIFSNTSIDENQGIGLSSDTSSQAPKGQTGELGPSGPIGAPGLKGIDGPKGDTGDIGDTGDDAQINLIDFTVTSQHSGQKIISGTPANCTHISIPNVTNDFDIANADFINLDTDMNSSNEIEAYHIKRIKSTGAASAKIVTFAFKNRRGLVFRIADIATIAPNTNQIYSNTAVKGCALGSHAPIFYPGDILRLLRVDGNWIVMNNNY